MMLRRLNRKPLEGTYYVYTSTNESVELKKLKHLKMNQMHFSSLNGENNGHATDLITPGRRKRSRPSKMCVSELDNDLDDPDFGTDSKRKWESHQAFAKYIAYKVRKIFKTATIFHYWKSLTGKIRPMA